MDKNETGRKDGDKRNLIIGRNKLSDMVEFRAMSGKELNRVPGR